ncbi:MAG: DNA repair protein RecN [Clostridiales bacterium]|nr:DNA repair protein RecN [Clostridiales bacterium]
MLLQISIRNFAIFKDAVLEPGDGYNAITGESGAGKSVIVNALSLICGARAYKEMIRTGETGATIEAVFRIPERKKKKAEETFNIIDELLVITREIHRDKPSICKINGKIRNLSQITELSSLFIDIHGQYENQTLMNIENHIKYLDDFVSEKLRPALKEYRKILLDYNKVTDSIISVSGGESERERNRQILEFQIEEINAAGLERINEKQLFDRKNLLENADKYRQTTSIALNILENEGLSLTDNIRNAIKELESLPENEVLKSIINNMNEAFFQLQDSSSELNRFNEIIEFDDKEYEEILDKIEKIKDLKRKYGTSIEEVIEFRNDALLQLNKIVNFKNDYSRNLDKLSELEKQLTIFDCKLTSIRKKSSEVLRAALFKELYDMGMKDSVIEVEFEKNAHKNPLGFINFPLNGLDECEFLISLNKGLTPVTLGRVASGGEMSRIMLSFKTVFSYKDDTETVVFDEIDSGISGEASIAVADKLEKLSRDKQIICITHLPQIAARAKNHYIIKKDSTGDITQATVIRIIENNEKIDVIASLTDGENITEEGRKHAVKILNENKKLFN